MISQIAPTTRNGKALRATARSRSFAGVPAGGAAANVAASCMRELFPLVYRRA
jgi:hypothetical protein